VIGSPVSTKQTRAESYWGTQTRAERYCAYPQRHRR
jgi:hypothetical protein